MEIDKEKDPIVVLWPQFAEKKEKAILVGLQLPGIDRKEIEDSLEELRELAKTAGAIVEKIEITKKDAPTPNIYIGEGKAEEIGKLCHEKGIDLVIFDDNLSPAQIKNLQNLLEVKVIDRTELILDIFAIHAKSREGKIQVELAQLQYMLPRLVHAWTHLSRQSGGIGTRGPGEKQLEVDRRRIRQHITNLSNELKKVHGHRKLQRKHREKIGIPLISIIGYTNAGKTTLFNRLTESVLPAEDKLFTTLDPKIKKFVLPNNQAVVMSDTVGFIKKLPHNLVESFKATLEEVYEADLLLHIIDGASGAVEEHYDVVLNLLKEMGVVSKPIITVINKIDLLTDSPEIVYKWTRKIPDSVSVSAKTGEGIEDLTQMACNELRGLRVKVEFFIPNNNFGIAAKIYNRGTVLSAEYTDKGARIIAELPKNSIGEFKEWIIE